MRVPAAWMGVGLWCFGSTEIPTEIGYGIGIGISGACMYPNVRRRNYYADTAIVMFVRRDFKLAFSTASHFESVLFILKVTQHSSRRKMDGDSASCL